MGFWQKSSQGGLQAERIPLSIHFSVVVVSVIDSIVSFVHEYLSEHISKLLLCSVFDPAVHLPVFNIIIFVSFFFPTSLSSVL